MSVMSIPLQLVRSASRLASGALPALKTLDLIGIPASDEAKAAVYAARADLGSGEDEDEVIIEDDLIIEVEGANES